MHQTIRFVLIHQRAQEGKRQRENWIVVKVSGRGDPDRGNPIMNSRDLFCGAALILSILNSSECFNYVSDQKKIPGIRMGIA